MRGMDALVKRWSWAEVVRGFTQSQAATIRMVPSPVFASGNIGGERAQIRVERAEIRRISGLQAETDRAEIGGERAEIRGERAEIRGMWLWLVEKEVRRRKLRERKLAAKERKFAAKERKFAECGYCSWKMRSEGGN